MVRGRIELHSGWLELDASRIVLPWGTSRLTALELRLLEYMARRPAQDLSRAELLREVWGYADGVKTRAVDQTVKRLRRKIEPDPTHPTLLLTGFGEGYRLATRRQFGAPTPAGEFVGRQTELAALLAWVARPALGALVGPPGLGKTRLTWELCAAASHLPVDWFDLSSYRSLEELSELLCARLDVDPGRADLSEALIRAGQALGERGELIVVLDNAEDLPDDLGDVLQKLGAAAPRARLLVTTRRHFDPVPAVLQLGPLSPDATVRLLEVRGVAARRGRALPESHGLQALAERLAGLPLAIELAAARLATSSPDELLAELRTTDVDLGDRAPGWPGASSLREAISWAWERMSPSMQHLLAAAATFPQTFDRSALEAVAGSQALSQDLAAVEELGLLHTDPGPTHTAFRLPAGVAEFARAFGEDLMAAHATWALEQAEALDPSLRRSAPEALDALEQLRSDLMAVARRFRDARGARAGLALLPWIIAHGPLEAQLSWTDELVERCREVDAAELSAALERRALLRARSGRIADAFADAQEAIACAAGPRDRAVALRRRGALYYLTGPRSSAAEDWRAALAAGDVLDESEAAGIELNLGTLAREGEEYAAAERLYRSALDRAARAGDRRTLMRACNSMAAQHQVFWRLEEAGGWFRRALDLASQLEDRASAATVHGNLAMIERSLARFEVAMEHNRRAVELAGGDDPRVRGHTLCRAANLCRVQGRPVDGVPLALEALALVDRVGDARFLAHAQETLAQLRHCLGELGEAEALYETAIEGHVAAKANRMASLQAAGLACCLAEQGREESARRWLERARALHAEASIEEPDVVSDLSEAAVRWLQGGEAPTDAIAAARASYHHIGVQDAICLVEAAMKRRG